MRLNELRDRIAVDLNDFAQGHEMTTWTKTQIDGYIIEAMQTVFQDRPSLFSERKVIQVSGANPQDICDCARIERVLGECDAEGNLIGMPLRRRSNSEKLTWTGTIWCPANPNRFRLREYSIDGEDTQLWVYPDVPPGLDVFVLVECLVLPGDTDITDEFDIRLELVPAIIQWVLFRAKAVDAENNPVTFQVAQDHRKAFWELINDQRRGGRPNVRSTSQSPAG